MSARLFWQSKVMVQEGLWVGQTYRAPWPPRSNHRARMAAKKAARAKR